MKTKLPKVMILATVLTVASITTASAHIEFEPNVVLANAHPSISLLVPHDCSAKSKTTEVKLQLPSNVDPMFVMHVNVLQNGKLVKGWKGAVVKSGGKNYYDVKGPAIKAGPIDSKNNLIINFMLSTPKAKGKSLTFPTVQYCTNGEKVNWLQPRPIDGSDPAESATPIPTLKLK